MKYLILTPFLISFGCSSNAQQKPLSKEKSNIVVESGILKSVYQIDLSKYQIPIDDINFEVESITLEHLLCIATDECDEDLLKELIKKGVDVNSKICEGDDVITYLAYCKDNGVKLTKLMLENGAKINGADRDNDSFLSYAISYNNVELVKYLIANGADKNQKDINRNMGCPPVHGCESLEMLKLLESNGFDLNAVCDNGKNLLHFAAKENHKDVAKYLIENKLVDINKKDKNGETPLDYAINHNNPEIEKLIK